MRVPTRPSRLALVILAAAGCAGTGQPVQDEAPPPEVVPLAPLAAQLAPRSLGTIAETPTAPMSLTASDGTGLRLVSMQARAVVSEPLAFTELHLVFDNPEDRTLEGHFTIDLPTGSAISRLAMKIGDHWQEGEVIERQAARVAYEDFLHRKQDPALLENQAGNRFSARVFPIPARGRKEIILAYSQALPDSRVPYELALAGLPELERLDVEVRIERPGAPAGAPADAPPERFEVHERHHTPTRNLEVRGAQADAPVGLRHGDRVVARVEVGGAQAPDPIDDLTILFDTSASRALDFDGQLRRLDALVARLREDGDFRLRVLAFDQEVAEAYAGPASGFGPPTLDAMYTRGAFGASDLEGALRQAARAGRASRVLLMTDGIATAGEAEVVALTSAARELAASGVVRLDAIIDGGLQDREVLAALTTAGLSRTGIVVDARLSRDEIAAKLRRTTLADLEVSVPGASFVWPRTLRGLQPGDEALVYAELPPEAVMRVVLEGGDDIASPSEPIALTPAAEPLLARALAGARIDALTLQRSALSADAAESRARLQAEIVALSTRHRVVSDFSALLVLETEADYARFAIDRRALADILTVGERGIEVLDRSKVAPVVQGGARGLETASRAATFRAPPTPGGPAEPPAAPDPDGPFGAAFAAGGDDEDVWGSLAGTEIGESYGVGGLGLVGTGRGGGGTGEGTIGLGTLGMIGHGGGGGGAGYGAGYGGRGVRVPQVRMARATVRGALDRDVVRRIVRAHLNEVRFCYNQGLARDPGLAGRLAIQFVIDASGRVTVAVVEESTLADAGVGTCAAKAVKRWRFPKPTGSSVLVTYPFVFEPGPGGGTGEGTSGLGTLGVVGHGGGGGRRARAPRVRLAAATVRGALDRDLLRRIVRAHVNEVKFCYEQGLARDPELAGRLAIQFVIDAVGSVTAAVVEESSLADARIGTCVANAVKRWRFPKPTGGNVVVTYPFAFEPGSGARGSAEVAPLRDPEAEGGVAEALRTANSPYEGRMFDVMTLLEDGHTEAALELASRWHDEAPGDVLALVAMGEALEALERFPTAARVYGSIIDLFPSRADMRRYAGYRLDRLPTDRRRLAIDTYRQAVAQRPDHPNSHRLYAWALVRHGKLEAAFTAILTGLDRDYPIDRFRGVDRVLREDAALIGAALVAQSPALTGAVTGRLAMHGSRVAHRPSTRFVMSWETDANDVDFHVHDAKGGHAFFSNPELASGGTLFADVTTGYGPECFAIEGTPRAFPYRLEANYYARGPMGYGMGTLQIVEHDGHGGLTFADRPFLIMKDQTRVDLGELAAPLRAAWVD